MARARVAASKLLISSAARRTIGLPTETFFRRPSWAGPSFVRRAIKLIRELLLPPGDRTRLRSHRPHTGRRRSVDRGSRHRQAGESWASRPVSPSCYVNAICWKARAAIGAKSLGGSDASVLLLVPAALSRHGAGAKLRDGASGSFPASTRTLSGSASSLHPTGASMAPPMVCRLLPSFQEDITMPAPSSAETAVPHRRMPRPHGRQFASVTSKETISSFSIWARDVQGPSPA